MPIEKTCEICQNIFKVKPSKAKTRFCSIACVRTSEGNNGRPAARKRPVDFTCQQCGTGFTMMEANVNFYRKRFGHDPKYCSRQCNGNGRKAATAQKAFYTCQQCGTATPRRQYINRGRVMYRGAQQFCSQVCKVAGQIAKAGAKFETGAYTRHFKRGYAYICIPSAITGGKRRFMLEHRYVMEKSLGRPLSAKETIHHKNGDRADNRLENLELRSGNHGPGQRITDKIAHALELLRKYPEEAKAAGFADDVQNVAPIPIVSDG